MEFEQSGFNFRFCFIGWFGASVYVLIPVFLATVGAMKRKFVDLGQYITMALAFDPLQKNEKEKKKENTSVYRKGTIL